VRSRERRYLGRFRVRVRAKVRVRVRVSIWVDEGVTQEETDQNKKQQVTFLVVELSSSTLKKWL
jgi:hypothetical protein